MSQCDLDYEQWLWEQEVEKLNAFYDSAEYQQYLEKCEEIEKKKRETHWYD